MATDIEIPRADFINEAYEFWQNLTDFSWNNTPFESKVKFLREKGCTIKEIAEGLRKFKPKDPNVEKLLSEEPSVILTPNQGTNYANPGNLSPAQQPGMPYLYPQPPNPYFPSFPSGAQTQESWSWGAAASLGLLASAMTYFGTRLFSNQELYHVKEEMTREKHELEREYEKKLAEKDAEISRIKKDVIEQVQLERERESQEVQEVVRLLKQQSDDVRKNLSILEETLALVQASQGNPIAGLPETAIQLLGEIWRKSPKPYEEVTLGTGVQDILAEKEDEMAWMTEDAKDDTLVLGNETVITKEIQVLPEVVVNKLVEAIMSDPNEKSRKKAVEYLKLRLQQLIDQPKNQKRREIHRNKMFTRFEKVPDCIRLLKTIGFQEDEHGSLLELTREDDPQKDDDQLELLIYAYERLSNPSSQSKLIKGKSKLKAVDIKARSEDPKKIPTKSRGGASYEEKNNSQQSICINSLQKTGGNVINSSNPQTSQNPPDNSEGPSSNADLDQSPIVQEVKNSSQSQKTPEGLNPPLPPRPTTIKDIQRYIQLGKQPEDVEIIDDSPPDPNAPFSNSQLTLPAKPYAIVSEGDTQNVDPSNIWGHAVGGGIVGELPNNSNPILKSQGAPSGLIFLDIRNGMEDDAAVNQFPVSEKTTLRQLKSIIASQHQCAISTFELVSSSGVVLTGDDKSMTELYLKDHDKVRLQWVEIPEVH